MIVLRFENGPYAGQEVEVPGPSVKIGSGALCEVRLIDPNASHEHCMLTETKQGLILRDLGSDTGTRVGSPDSGPIFTPVAIKAGDRFYVGGTTIVVIQRLDDGDVTIAPTRPEERAVLTQEVRLSKRSKGEAPATETAAPRDLPPARSSSRADAPESVGFRAPPRSASRTDAHSSRVRRRRPSRVASGPSGIDATLPADPAGTDDTHHMPQGPTDDVPMPSSAPAIVVDPAPDEDPEDSVAQYGLTARLVFLSGPHDGRYVFFGDEPVVVGRREDNDVALADAQVAPHSFRITRAGDAFRLEPLDDVPKLNGTTIPKAGAVLGHGQVITVGASEMEFLAPGIDMDAEDAMETVVMRQPIFAHQGRVEKVNSIDIGRDPECSLFLDDRRVERHHARVKFEFPAFYLEAVEGAAVYVDDVRVVKHRLKDGDVAKVGGFELTFEIQGYRCNIDLHAPEPDVEIPKFSQDVEVASPFMTIFRLPGDFGLPSKKEGEQEEKQEDVDREELLWQEPGDVKRTWRVPLLVATGVVCSLGLTGVLLFEGGGSFLRRPISERHRSEAFAAMAQEKNQGESSCFACHRQFEGPVAAQCESCHEGHIADLRPAHQKVEALAKGACTECHGEHPRSRTVTALVDGRCARCHEDRHQAMRPVAAVLATQAPPEGTGLFAADLKADLAFGDDKALAIHRRHGKLKRGCAACHAGGMGVREQPWGACFGCHQPVTALSSERCADCHREHGEAWAKAPVETLLDPSPAGTAVATLMLLVLPMGLVFFGHAAFRRRSRWEDRAVEAASSEEEEPLKCVGVERGKAKKLPRLLASKCTGSGDCVEACPYQVLEMVEKRPVVRAPELCHECTTCVQKCGPGALMMWEPDKPLPMQPRPALDPNYQTGIKGSDGGVYVIGEAAGKPLVKNGINVGYWTIQHMKHEGIGPGSAVKAGVEYDVVIAGSGPAGISAAMTAASEGLSYVLLEKREFFAGTVQDYPKKKKLMESPPAPTNDFPQGVRLVGPLWMADTTKEEALERWAPEVEKLNIKYREHVSDVDPSGPGFVVKTKSGSSYTCLRLILAPGTRGDPRKLGKPGEDLPKVRYRLADAEEHDGHKVMVVGGGDSALEAAIQLAEVHGGSNTVSIVYRKDAFSRAKPGNKNKIDELVKAGRIQAHMKSNPEKVTETTVLLDTGVELENDFVYCMLGAHPPIKWLESLGIETVQKPIDWEPPPSDQPAFLQFADT